MFCIDANPFVSDFKWQSIQSCMVRLSNYLPDVFKNSTLVVFTHCADAIKCIYDKDKLPFAPISKNNLFYMENSFFTASPAEVMAASEDTKSLFQFEWSRSMNVMGKIVSRITELGDTLTKSLVEVRKSRDELAAALCDMRLEIRRLQDAQKRLDEIENAMAVAKANKSQFASFTKTTRTIVKKMVDAPYHSTICGTCNFICHEGCNLDEIQEYGSHKFTTCSAFFGGDLCRSCPGQCFYMDHFHDRKRIIDEEISLDEVIEDIKSKYDSAAQAYSQALSQQGGLAAARLAVQAGINSLLLRIQQACHSIKNHCSNFNLALELAVMIRQLETERDLLTNLKAIETANLFIKTIKDIVDTLSLKSSSTGVYSKSKERGLPVSREPFGAKKKDPASKGDLLSGSGGNHMPSPQYIPAVRQNQEPSPQAQRIKVSAPAENSQPDSEVWRSPQSTASQHIQIVGSVAVQIPAAQLMLQAENFVSLLKTVDAATAQARPVVIFFFAQWCEPCRKFEPTLTKLSAEFPLIHFVKVDVDNVEEASDLFEVRSVPTFILISNGEVVQKMNGANEEIIREHMNNLMAITFLRSLVM